MKMAKSKVWIELERPENKEHAEEQCKLVNNMLTRLGAKGQSFFYDKRTLGYSLETSPGGCYKELLDNGEWFNLDFLGREGE